MPTLRHAALLVSILTLVATASAQMTLRVDATDAPRRLLHAELTMPATPGPMDVFYVEWTPGNHNPSGPVQNVVNFRVSDDSGNELEWKRDPTDVVRTSFVVPDGATGVTLSYSYILNQPTTNSKSTDSYGRRGLGVINWNTILFEPAGSDKDELSVETSVSLPGAWILASPLPQRFARGGHYQFEPVSFAYLVDSPAIYGEFLATWPMNAPGDAPHFTDAVASEPSKLELSDDVRATLDEMLKQTQEIFGPFPYTRYHFLTVLDSDVPGAGLEHTECTYISYPNNRFSNDDASALGTFPHEYIHAWNGKLRAPEGLLHRDYHTAGRTELLWVYEGLTSYYDDVIMARSGMYTPEEYEDALTGYIEGYQMQTGRLWRSIEDTASAQRHLRDRGHSWQEVRRRQDYYGEGALFWMSADAVIRTGTNNERSLDDFARAFFDVTPIATGTPVTYTRADVVAGLTEVYPRADWDAMIREYIERPAETLEHPVVNLLNRDWGFSAEPTVKQAKDEKAPYPDLLKRTLGFATNNDGVVTTVLADTPADTAMLSYGMTVLGVDGWAFTPELLKERLKHTQQTGRIDLVVRFDDRIEARAILYDGGVRYPRMVQREGAFDVLGAIIEAK